MWVAAINSIGLTYGLRRMVEWGHCMHPVAWSSCSLARAINGYMVHNTLWYICVMPNLWSVPISRNRQAYCPVREVGTVSAHFTNWPISLPTTWIAQHHEWNIYARMYVRTLQYTTMRHSSRVWLWSTANLSECQNAYTSGLELNVRENVSNLSKNVKSHFLDFQKKR